MIRRAIVELDVDLDQEEFEKWLISLLDKVARDPAYKAKITSLEEMPSTCMP
jgi:hypothetical protein